MTNATPETPLHSPLPAAASATNTLGLVSIIAGAAGIVFGHTVVVPIVAIIFGFLARSREPRPHTLGTWGIILGFLGLFGWILVGLLAASFALPFVIGGAIGLH